MLPEGFSFAQAKNENSPIAQKIIFSVLHEYGLGGIDHHTDSDLKDIEKTYTNGYFGLIKNDSGNPVGTFGLFPLNEKSAEIRKMYLLPEARGKGIGKWMVNFLIEKAKELNFQKLELETASVLLEAMELYKKFGFKEVKSSNASPRCDRAFKIDLYKN